MRRFLLAAMMLCVVPMARAADMPDVLRGSFTDGLSHTNVNWQGVYVGVQGSWGSANTNVPGNLNSDMQSTFHAPPGIGYPWGQLQMTHELRAGYGAFVGYNSQWDSVVVGIEGNYIHDGFNRTTYAGGIGYAADNVTVLSVVNQSATVKLPDWGSMRVRAGYVTGCFLPYAFAGVGLGEQTVDRYASATPSLSPGWMNDSKSKIVYGYTLGAGVDMTLWGGLFARAEYEYRRITNNLLAGVNTETDVNTVRVGLGYRF